MILQLSEWSTNGISVSIPGKLTGEVISSAESSSGERVALDLHVGSAYQSDHQWLQMPQKLVLRPNECIRVEVREEIHTPDSVFGSLCSRASLTAQGLLVSNIKVDPKFHGRLKVAVFNAGSKPIKLEKDKAFASIWFATLTNPLPADAPSRVPTATDGLVYKPARERVRAVLPYAATVVTSVVAGVLLKLL